MAFKFGLHASLPSSCSPRLAHFILLLFALAVAWLVCSVDVFYLSVLLKVYTTRGSSELPLWVAVSQVPRRAHWLLEGARQGQNQLATTLPSRAIRLGGRFDMQVRADQLRRATTWQVKKVRDQASCIRKVSLTEYAPRQVLIKRMSCILLHMLTASPDISPAL